MNPPVIRLAWALAVLAALASPADAQSLPQAVAGVRDGAVSFHYAARPGICGDGARYMRIGRNSYVGGLYDGAPCIAGAVQVRLMIRAGEVERVEAWVGPVRDREARDLGRVPAAEAARFLLALVASDASPATAKAIQGAVLADSIVVWPALLDLARADRARAVRQDATLWLSRFAGNALAGRPNDILDHDDGAGSEDDDVRTHAVFVASQLRGGAGVPVLIDVARSPRASLRVRQSALFWLGQSGDPRALDVFRQVLR